MMDDKEDIINSYSSKFGEDDRSNENIELNSLVVDTATGDNGGYDRQGTSQHDDHEGEHVSINEVINPSNAEVMRALVNMQKEIRALKGQDTGSAKPASYLSDSQDDREATRIAAKVRSDPPSYMRAMRDRHTYIPRPHEDYKTTRLQIYLEK